jgi:anaerobic selenocysteine-containing dehydrogenase
VRPEGRTQTLTELVADIEAGIVDVLVVLEGNPAYTAPADLHFADHLQKVALRVHHGLFFDETAELCHWHVPATHYLEQWGDLRAVDGTITICQPLIAPLYEPARSSHEVLAAFFGDNPLQTTYETVRGRWETTPSRQRPPQARRVVYRRGRTTQVGSRLIRLLPDTPTPQCPMRKTRRSAAWSWTSQSARQSGPVHP